MQIRLFDDRATLGAAAAAHAAAILRGAIQAHGRARMVAATGSSQFEMLDALSAAPGIDWARVELFHLDEYVGLRADHPASFRRFLRDRLTSRVGIRIVHWLDGDGDVEAVIRESGRAIQELPIDLALTGIGENGHLAFNDPPANFETEEPFLVVSLDDASRRQQVGEGWFASLTDVPRRAVTMSVRQVMRSREILCLVPDSRKAAAVHACLDGPVTPMAPASALQGHPNVTVYLDPESAALLRRPLD
jgi:glucosamine-6-phosphate deaminase